MGDMRKLIAIVGPTASGKTALAIDLARGVGGEIVGADSRQVYRRMDVGTAKPTPEEQAAVCHHLIDLVEPDESFGLGGWLDLAREALADIWSRGRQPLLVGGTGQYVWALAEGWRVPRVPPQAGLRREMAAWPPEDLIAELRLVDPEAERFIDPRNVRRVIRALEVQRATGKPFSYWRAKAPPEFETLIIGLAVPRDELYLRIGARVDAMIEAGLVDEVRSLLAMGYSRDLPSMSGIGYKEMCEYLTGEIDLPTAIERTKTGTHRLARHQNSWFKAGDERIQWVKTGGQAWALVREFLGAGTTAGGAVMNPEIETYSRYIQKEIASIRDLLHGLTDEQMNWQPPLPGSNSLYVITSHVLGNARAWVLGIACGQPMGRDRPAEFAASGTWADIEGASRQLSTEIESALAAVDEARLDRRMVPPQELWGEGEPQEISVREALAHVLEHASIHLGHVQMTRGIVLRHVAA